MFGRGPVPKNGWPIPNSALTFKPANPNSPTVDAFDCGDEWFEKEVTETVHGRKWDRSDVWAYEFFLKGKSVGFAYMVNKKYATPWWDSPDQEYVRYIYTAGINRRFRKMPDPHRDAGVTVAESMFRSLEGLPRAVERDGRHLGDVAGMFLTVYTENGHAQRFYSKLDYEQDHAWGVRQTGPRQADTIAMRKTVPQQ